ncbi:MFS transporter [Gordonia hankookensis]|uniref:MFS transporter n=1 Tax=Gordonia hankookensis TaxID=589403 RepID=A0ABR7WID4_9ACTN|nr:MFS transporter [Gordonia hankookensis]MBD1322521.1 MFS transporter [Gordonia hankookensis]
MAEISRLRRSVVVALCGGYFLVLLDVTVVNVALPSIGHALSAQGAGLASIVDAYTVPLAALLLSAGAIGDRVGHRRMVLVGLIGFGAASVLCASASGLSVLILGRLVQGVAAAVMLPGTLAMLTESAVDDRQRTRLVGVWAAVGGAAVPAGPVIGGFLVQEWGWPSVFWVNVPVIAATAVMIARSEPAAFQRDADPVGDDRVDWAGAVVLAAAIAAATVAVLRIRSTPTDAVVALSIAVAASVGFVNIERRTRTPLLRVERSASRSLIAACLVAGLMNACVLGTLFVLTQLLQSVHHLSPSATGLVLLPALLPLPLLGPVSARTTARFGPWPTSALGLTMSAIGFAVIASTADSLDRPLVAAGFVVWGIGLGMLTPAIVTAAIEAAPATPGAASGASNTARQIGAALGVAIFAAATGSSGAPGFDQRVSWAIVTAAAAFAIAAAIITARRVRLGRSRAAPRARPGPR